MPKIPIVMPQLGESIAEATIINIGVQVGDTVTGDQEIFEVETNKAMLNVSAPAPGKVTELLVEPQVSYAVGAVLGYLEVTADDMERLGLAPAAGAPDAVDSQRRGAGEIEMPEAEPGIDSEPAASDDTPHFGTDEATASIFAAAQDAAPAGGKSDGSNGLPVPARLGGGAGWFSPRLQARMRELGLQPGDLAGVAGTGAGGRVTVADMEKFVAAVETRQPQTASSMRLAVADAMRRSWSRPLATVGRPIALDAVFAHRATFADPKPGLALFALRALALALAEADNGAPAARLVGGRLVLPASIDLGVAVEAPEGIMVPVLRAVDKTPLRDLAAVYADLVARAKQRRLPAEATEGAVASVTNFGPFGLTWGTPIPLPDQTLILGLGATEKAPRWDEASGSFLPVTQAEFTLSFDHRSLDGGGAGRLLARIAALAGGAGGTLIPRIIRRAAPRLRAASVIPPACRCARRAGSPVP